MKLAPILEVYGTGMLIQEPESILLCLHTNSRIGIRGIRGSKSISHENVEFRAID